MPKIIDSAMKHGRVAAVCLCLLASLSFILSCVESDDLTSGRITVIGSESAWRVMFDEAREFMAMYGKASVKVLGGGSIAGLEALFESPSARETVLAVSTRPLSTQEKANAVKQGYKPKEYKVAMDGIAIIVNATNKVEELTLEQVRDIFSGRIRNWQEVGGTNRPIRVLFGNPNSGTYEQLRDSVLGSLGLAPGTEHHDSMFQLIRAVQEDPAAISYCGSTYLYRDWLVRPPNPEPNIRALALSRTSAGPFVTPDQGTIYDKSYPLWRYCYLIARQEPKGAVSGFVTFVMSAKGQQIITADGLAPVTVKFIVNREEPE